MIIFVTGGASGLGEAITRKLADDKMNHVYFTFHHSAENAKKIETELKNTTAIHCNFLNETDIQHLQEKIGTLDADVLVNNAYTGSFIQSYFHKMPVEEFRTGFESNLIPVITITQSAINHFRKKKYGKIITILTAVLQRTPPMGTAVYMANKAYLAALCKVWANENKKFTISSNTVSPSFMITGMTQELDERLIEQIAEQEPGKKLLTVEETANAVAFFVNAPQEITGVDKIINPGEYVI